MSNQHRVIRVDKTLVNKNQWWGVQQQGPDGALHIHVFPPEVLVNKAVEYGIDPADSPAVLDVILHERFLSHADMDPEAPDFVYNCDPDTARTAHLARISRVKTDNQVVDPDDLLSQIHRSHEVDPALLERAHLHVGTMRSRREQRRG